ncbi:MAG TPA: RNase adapter RapZ, partial [Anaerolineales bacterium]
MPKSTAARRRFRLLVADIQFLIITGLSGAGKSNAMKVFEDLGFFCVDNLPPALVPKFAELCLSSDGRI